MSKLMNKVSRKFAVLKQFLVRLIQDAMDRPKIGAAKAEVSMASTIPVRGSCDHLEIFCTPTIFNGLMVK